MDTVLNLWRVKGIALRLGLASGQVETNVYVRILLVANYVMMRAGLRMLIEARTGFELVGECDNHAQAVALAEARLPDIILLDSDLGTDNGLEMLGALLDVTQGRSRVIVLMSDHDLQMHSRAVGLGALGVVLKNHTPEVLLSAIEKVSQGEVWLERNTIAIALADIWKNQQSAEADPEAIKIASLTQRERDVINLVAQGLKNKQIAEALYISEPTMRRALASIFAKLALTDRVALTVYAFQHNLITSADSS